MGPFCIKVKYYHILIALVKNYDSQKAPDHTGKSLKSFTFDGKNYDTKYWKDMLVQICTIVAKSHQDDFDNILKISGRKMPFFSKNSADLRSPKQIEGTDVFVETNIGSAGILRLSKSIISLFGYPESDLSIEAE